MIDFPKDRERIRSRHLFEFVSPNLRNPICGFGYGRPLGILDLSGRCQFQIDMESGIQTRTGRADPTVFDDYAGIGANFTFEAFTELDDKQQVIISANGRYVPIIAGTAPDLWKIAVSAKRRYWVSEFIGFDFGIEFSDGRNELTQEEEKKLAIGLGVIL